jgi:hypothetical protein
MQRRSLVTIMCFSYAAYGAAVLWRALLVGIVRPQHHLGPWFILAILGLLCYGMATRRRWARALGLFVGVGSLMLWAMVLLWGTLSAGLAAARVNRPSLFSWWRRFCRGFYFRSHCSSC